MSSSTRSTLLPPRRACRGTGGSPNGSRRRRLPSASRRVLRHEAWIGRDEGGVALVFDGFAQQQRDGWLTFWRRYLFSKDWRYIYELEAYRVWLNVAPTDFWKVVSMMKNYGFTVSEADIISALSKR